MAKDWFKGIPDADLNQPILSAGAAAAGRRGIRGVVVYDYGQGDCSAIVDRDGEPVVFFDMGGGKQTGSKTHPWHVGWRTKFAGAPWRLKLPKVKHEPTVILSHWDGDHYSTAYYLAHPKLESKTVPPGAPDVTALKWLVPRQCKHPSKLAFVTELKDLSCWPAGVAQHRFQLGKKTFLQVERCAGSGKHDYDPNLDGLALIVERVDDGGEVVEQMLLPGDAPYGYIPSCRQKRVDKLVALLAFHHGSETHLGATRRFIPAATGETPRIVYTYGVKPNGGRCFGHPSAKAVQAYQKQGWAVSQQTAGSFKRWPPRAADHGDPATRSDIELPFTAPDAAVSPPTTPASTRREIAMRRGGG